MAYTTNKSLLNAIRQGDEVSWDAFYDTYKPLVIHCAKMQNVPSTSYDDILQVVMVRVFQAQKSFKFDPSKGRFRSFLGKIIHNAIVDYWSKMQKSNCQLEENVVNDESFTNLWDSEWKKHILNQALAILRSKVDETTFQAFELYALKGQKVAQVAKFLGLSTQNVYEAKSRCINIMRREIKGLEQ